MTRLQLRQAVLDTGFVRTDKDTQIYLALDFIFDEVSSFFPTQQTEETWSAPLISGQADYPLPSDMTLQVGDIIYRKDASTAWELNKLSRESFFRKYPNTFNTTKDYGDLIDYCIYGTQIIVGPVLQTLTAEKLEIKGVEVEVRLTTDSGQMSFETRWDRMVIYGIRWQLELGLDNDEDAAKYSAYYQRDLERLKGEDTSKTYSIQCQDFQDI